MILVTSLIDLPTLIKKKKKKDKEKKKEKKKKQWTNKCSQPSRLFS